MPIWAISDANSATSVTIPLQRVPNDGSQGYFEWSRTAYYAF